MNVDRGEQHFLLYVDTGRLCRRACLVRATGEHSATAGRDIKSTEAVRKLGERFRMAARSENFLDFSRSARR
jgi:hypothetical protein